MKLKSPIKALFMDDLLEKTLQISRQANEADIKNILRTAVATGIIGGVPLGLTLRSMNGKEPAKPAAVVRKVDRKPSRQVKPKPVTVAKAEQEKPQAKPSKAKMSPADLDMDKIIQIESSGDPNAENKRTGARGLCQITRPTWEECVKLMGVNWSWDEAFDPEKNRAVGEFYANVRIPEMLRAHRIPDTIESRIVAYNWGIGHLNRTFKKYVKDYLEHIPKETRDYIRKYHGMSLG